MEQLSEQRIVGLDVGKAWLDGHLSSTGERFRFGNDPAGIDALVRRLGDSTACLVVMEASGGYERLPHRELIAHGVLAAIVNPKRVRDFARSMGKEAKTDRIDAAVIAEYGRVVRPAPTPLPEPAKEGLAEILACRRQTIDEITVRRQQSARLRTATAQERMAKALEFLEQERRELDRLLRRAIQADAGLEADFQLLTSMPGCGPILAATLLAEMPELGTLDRRKIAALAGLAPIARDSGLRHGQRVIKGGRGQVRRVLYMAAIATLTHKDNPFKDRYQALLDRGKPAKLALVAVMRKMLVTLNAMMRNRQRWISPA